ncbi:hypothetical protein DGG96_02260 [Legionella qingyii]|uniref:Uncharacterized protein n=1 Tax=Legionella qingyii TaxID=2184757 RepID=A0A317U570_9GAMM|nr:hypothetical protein [Legionella qingyii]PWY56490.1 hypothetical protein DGG96_06930 [Legionella qingyii]PWY57153.1 hypothetical protein DGG96_02260 [Legionella qingyii]RUR25007.1 hypothetical protein ELY20_04415 [Legionella qingyii]RUR28721.1 hypothetical protein ELY16_01565 [Legionella qingyii]
MKKHPWFNILYSIRHPIAIFCTIVGFFIIQHVALLLYIKPYQPLDILKLSQMLWHSNSLFLQMILIFNIFIKPLFIYFFVIFLFYCFKNKNL